ncbi:Ig-like domain-containing protein, partial [Chitinophaga ginsengisoli]
TQKPTVPTITTAQTLTSDNTPTVTGTAEANSTVTIYVDGSAVGTTTADASGNYTFTVPTALTDGTHAFTATATDAVGNVSAPSATLNITIDTQKPTVPTITTAQTLTSDNTPTVTGTAEANSTVTIYVDGSAVGTTTANAGGNYTFTVPTALTDGTYAFTAIATDAVGNVSAPSATLNITIDTQKPTVPTITTAQTLTSDNTPTVTGAAEANSTVTIYVDGSAVGTTTADASGNYTFTVPTALTDGTHAFNATATDAVGNVSAPSATLNITIDTQKPTVPTITTAQTLTSDNTPTVTGTAEASSTVTIYVDGSAVGTTTANAGGNYTFTVPTALTDGTHAFTATATDAVGNVSAPSATLNITIDTQAPTAPTITTAQTLTSDNTPTVTGTAEANSTVTIYVDGSAVGTTTANAGGNYTFTVPTALTDGTHAFTATATDAVGNVSAPSATLNITIDTQKPTVPTITTAQTLTSDNTPTVTGTAEANSTVTIYVDGSAVGTTTANAGGNYTFTVPTALTDGTHAFTATATDAVGNVSAPSATLNITIDTQKPTVPTITTAQTLTSDNTPTVTGTAEANSTVTIYVDGAAVGTTTANASGNYTFTVPTALTDGTHAFTATATDAVGNVSAPSATLNITIDTQAPVTPTITTAQTPTSDNTPTVTGTAEANSTVTIYVDNNIVGTTTADASGNYTFTVPTPLSDGTHGFTATATDAVGNTSAPSASLIIVIDTKAPAVPTITTAQTLTSDNTPTVTGTAEANSTVTIYVDGNVVGTTTANASGNYTFTVPTPISDGTHAFTATATDAVGNTSAPSTTLNITIDTQKPAVPTITTAQTLTSDNTPTVTGTAEANSTVTIYVDGNVVGTTTANASGNYTFTVPTPLSDGTHGFTATATDAVGNTSAPSTTLNITIDTQKPAVPTITTAQTLTSDNTPTVTGTAEANSTVTIYVDGNAAGITTANASGNYTFTVPTALADGTHAFTATATDAVGNVSAPSATLNVTIDTKKPIVPTITTAQTLTSDNTPTVTGTAEANSTVTIYVDGNAIGTTTTDASGKYTFTVPVSLSDGTHAFTATATDAVGNVSAPSATLNITIDTQAPAAPTITTAQTLTNDNTPTVTGTAEANSSVTIYVDGNAIGSTTADASGKYTFTVPTSLSDGTHAFTATAKDAVGNVSAPSATLSITIDTKAPAAPTLTTDKTPTSDNTPTVSGTAEANSTVTIYKDGNAVGTTKADASGNYTYTFNPALADGSYAITATATDAAGNTSAHSPALNITIDAAAPATPAAPQLIGGTNGITSDATPSIKGDAEANSTVTVYVDGKPAGTTKTDASGHYTYTFDPALADGPHNITVTATDATGNTSGQSPALAIVIDTQAPAVPTLTTDKSPTNDNTPTVTGKAEPNSTVTVYVDGKPAGTTTADNNGNYSYTFNPALADGNHNVTTTATDAAGNTSAQTPPLSLTVDTQAPAAPTIVLETASNNGVITTSKPTISGAAEPNSTVTIYADGVVAGTATADASGHYTYTFNNGLSQGAHAITATATDAAGNTSLPGGPLAFSIDAMAPGIPSAPVLPGINIPGLVNTGTPRITGRGEPGTTITIYTNGKPVGTADVNTAGDWSYTYHPELAEGAYNITVTASDKQGNESGHSNQVVMTVDLTRPEVSLMTRAKEPLNAPAVFTFTFSEDVIGFEATDINVNNGTVKEIKQLSPTIYDVVIVPLENGILTVNVPADKATDMAGNGNSVSSTLALRVKFGISIDLVYPMPASDVVNVRFSGLDFGEATYTMTSMAGQVLLQQNGIVKDGILTFSTQRVPSGTYVLYIRMKDHSFNTTVVIAR